MGKKSDWDLLEERAAALGWRIRRTKKGHRQLFSPDGRTIIVTAGTSSDWRAFHNFRSRLKDAMEGQERI